MSHTPLIATIVVGIGLAFVLGTLANHFRLSPLVGYLAAGVLIGPFTPGFVADQALARQLAELGVILLMFGAGLHFSLDNLLSVKTIALPGALGQVALVTVFGLALTQGIGWPIGAGLVFGLALSVASTVVVLRTLRERRLIETEQGRIAIAWLIVQDLAMILALVLLPLFADALGGEPNGTKTGESGLFAFLVSHTFLGALGLTLVKLAAFFAVMMVVGRRLIPWVLHYVAHTGSRELFRLAVLAIALGVAFGAAELFDVSFALGAFFFRHDPGRISTQPKSRTGDAAAPRRIRSPILCVSRDAVRSYDTPSGAPACWGDIPDHRSWQCRCRIDRGAHIPIFAPGGTHARCKFVANRRVLFHSRGPRYRVKGSARSRA
jgi:monovalent cation:H+ antiporter-2, CPA2 family